MSSTPELKTTGIFKTVSRYIKQPLRNRSLYYYCQLFFKRLILDVNQTNGQLIFKIPVETIASPKNIFILSHITKRYYQLKSIYIDHI